MSRPQGFQTYAVYRDREGGKRRWLPIGDTPTERFIAKAQLRDGGKLDVRIRRGRPLGAVRVRRPSH
jgi:hypothetical protein